MRLLWLPTVLRSAGVRVREYGGWRDRGNDDFGPVRGITCHGTAGSLTSTDAGELRTIAITGSSSAPAPISQLYLSRSGVWWVVASGTCYHSRVGWGGPNEGFGNDNLLGIEAQHHPSEPWTAVQYQSYVRGVAALVRHKTPGWDVPLAHVAGHYEHQPNDKTDPWFDMGKFRLAAAAIVIGDEMSKLYEEWPAAWGNDPDGKRRSPAQWIRDTTHALIWGTPAWGKTGPLPDVPQPWIVEQVEAIRAGQERILAALVGGVQVPARVSLTPESVAEVAAAVDVNTRDAVADLGEGGAAGVRADS